VEDAAYKELLEKRRRWYKTIGRVYCCCLKTDVVFNSRGFRHVLYDSRGEIRPLADRVRRLRLLPLAVTIVIHSETVNEHRFQGSTEYWEILKRFPKKNMTVSVILSKKGSGQTIFLSIM